MVAGTCALLMDLQRISLRWECRCSMAVAFLQVSPWRPLASTCLPQGHSWGWHVLVPSRWPTATRMASLLKPIEEIGAAWSQSPTLTDTAVVDGLGQWMMLPSAAENFIVSIWQPHPTLIIIIKHPQKYSNTHMKHGLFYRSPELRQRRSINSQKRPEQRQAQMCKYKLQQEAQLSHKNRVL